MAISKVVYKSSANATPAVWMDATPATASASNIISPYTAMLANGIVTQGTGSGGGGGLEYETGTWTPASDVATEWISFADSHTSRPIFAMIEDSNVNTAPATSWTACTIDNILDFNGSAGTWRGIENRRYKDANSSHNGTRENFTSDSVVDNYLTSSAFRPCGTNTGYYWRSGRTYKWIAVWAPST